MRLFNTILAIIFTLVNYMRYNLPTYYNEISIFDTLTLISMGFIIIIALLDKNIFTEGVLVYNLLGVADSLIDELFGDPELFSKSDKILPFIYIGISLFIMFIRIKGLGKNSLFMKRH